MCVEGGGCNLYDSRVVNRTSVLNYDSGYTWRVEDNQCALRAKEKKTQRHRQNAILTHTHYPQLPALHPSLATQTASPPPHLAHLHHGALQLRQFDGLVDCRHDLGRLAQGVRHTQHRLRAHTQQQQQCRGCVLGGIWLFVSVRGALGAEL